jgi:hypothetical protein
MNCTSSAPPAGAAEYWVLKFGAQGNISVSRSINSLGGAAFAGDVSAQSVYS